MNKGLLLSAMLLIGAAAYGEYKEGYYDAMDGKEKAELKSAAKSCVSSHTKLNYTDLPNHWVISDVYPDLYDGELRFWDMYSDKVYVIHNGETGKAAFSRNSMQREHSVPKSWWKKNNDVEYTPAYSDMWNLFPSDGPANNAKSNYPFGVVKEGKASFDNGVSKIGTPTDETGGGASKVFEPFNDYKGDFARSIFYMATVYDDLPWVVNNYNTMFRTEKWPTLTQWAIDMLLEWSRNDPVSEKEISRNDAVETQQKNRNPFVDFPELAEYIWGNKTTEVFFLNTGSVEGINVDSEPAFSITDGYIRILHDSKQPVIVVDITGRILLRVESPRNGDTYPLPASGLMIVSSGSHTRKVLN